MDKVCPMANGKPCLGKECIFWMGFEVACIFIESYLHSLQSTVRISPYVLSHISHAVESDAFDAGAATEIVERMHQDLLASLRMFRYLEDNPIYPKAKKKMIREMRLKLKQEMQEFGDD